MRVQQSPYSSRVSIVRVFFIKILRSKFVAAAGCAAVFDDSPASDYNGLSVDICNLQRVANASDARLMGVAKGINGGLQGPEF